MIDYKLMNGDLVKRGLGDLKMVTGIEAKKQSMLIRLTLERGSFIYDDALGSRIKLLYREKRSRVPSMADLYVREALEPEPDITIEKVEVKWLDDKKIFILVFFIWNGIQDRLEVIA
jgi:phage gp46-like protein